MVKQKFAVVLGFICLIFGTTVTAKSWFNDQTALYSAHKAFLEGDYLKGFETSIEVLQHSNDSSVVKNIDRLIGAANITNCGRNLLPSVIPNWLSSLSVKRMTTQNPGQLHHQLLIQFDSKKPIASLSFLEWSDKYQLINPSITIAPSKNKQTKQYLYASELINNRIKNGLYKLSITADDDKKTT